MHPPVVDRMQLLCVWWQEGLAIKPSHDCCGYTRGPGCFLNPPIAGAILEGHWSHLRPPAGCGIVGASRAWLRPTAGYAVTEATLRGHFLNQGCLPGGWGACQHRQVGWDRSVGEHWSWVISASKVDRECQNWHPPLLDQLDRSREGESGAYKHLIPRESSYKSLPF